MTDLSQIDIAILCGGLGKRLRGTIGEVQKTVAHVDGQPFLDIILEYLSVQGFRRVILCTGFQAEQVESCYRYNPWELTIEFSREDSPLGTGGAVKNARTKIQSQQFIVINGDCFCPVDYQAFVKSHEHAKTSTSLVASFVDEAKDFGTIEINSDGNLVGFREKSIKGPGLANAGIYLFNQNVWDLMPAQNIFSLEYDLFPQLIPLGVHAFKVRADFFDIGTPERYSKAQEIFKKKTP